MYLPEPLNERHSIETVRKFLKYGRTSSNAEMFLVLCEDMSNERSNLFDLFKDGGLDYLVSEYFTYRLSDWDREWLNRFMEFYRYEQWLEGEIEDKKETN